MDLNRLSLRYSKVVVLRPESTDSFVNELGCHGKDKKAHLLPAHMSSIPEVVQFQVLTNEPAANADRLDDLRRGAALTSGWDPYEVWVRLIKQPRDRRRTETPN